jgi:predicted nuclease of predicted toxin-antitoxin system
MPKFIVDECTGLSVVHFLRKLGYDTMSVSESMPQAIDADILQRAIIEERIVVTNDKDFGDMEGGKLLIPKLAVQSPDAPQSRSPVEDRS